MSSKTIAKRTIKAFVPPKLWAALRKRRRVNNLEGFERRVVEHRYHNQPLRILIADGLARGWYDKDGPWMYELERLGNSQLKPGAVVYDCGAHQGIVALILARLAGPEGLVVAVEANAHNHAVATENARLNPDGRARIEHVHAALSDQDGTLTFTEDLNGQISHHDNQRAGRTEVTAVTLDTLASRYPAPDVVFIDIEGAEQLALKACSSLFENGRKPDWFVEVHAGHGLEAMGGSAPDIVSFFRKRGYRLEVSSNDGEPFTPLSDRIPEGRFFLLALNNDN